MQVTLLSHRKYTPHVVITEHSTADLSTVNSVAISFPEASFVTVTSYCSPDVADIKTRHNPYALHAKKLR